ncbi:class C beta-lactamase-related serine hydrolase [Thalassobius vesicularis]|uniref:Class C beta-lactamase-related serine hydrolase n=1 Tax=Thalassobius vesicularis TaxID=1294297 RepID=A0A4S3M8L0_9RHOB|nr:serine hydrolase [Thalassobius vesicularis]THD73026.1 class C beta-lactamase-related serine hydrolase [Thalassobius vesicularis]
MRYAKWAFRVITVIILISGGLVVWKKEEITRLLAVNHLFDADRIVQNFSSMDQMFWTAALDRGTAPVSPLPKGEDAPLPEGSDAWLTERAVTALVVLKDGQIRHEGYYQGTGPEDRRISWSMAKSFLASLFGIVLQDGAIASMDDPVTKYAPQLAGSAYDGARIIDVLHMASGVKFNEDYLDFNSDINRMGRVLALGGSMDGFAAGLAERDATPGQTWHYVSIDTHVIGMVIRGATGRTIPDLMAEKLIRPLGLEETPLMITDGTGVGFVLGGLNMRTRDYARFGQMVAQGGTWQGQRLLPEGWVETASAPSAPTSPGKEKYGLQWWLPSDAQPGEFYAIGVYGQYIYINRPKGVVIAMNSADRLFKEDGVNRQNIEMFRRITDSFVKE